MATITPELLDVLAVGHPPAFATDSRERIVFWNTGAAALLDKRADEVLGRRCCDVIGGRDATGSPLCLPSCSVVALARKQEPISAFEVCTSRGNNGSARPVTLNVTVLRIPGPRPDLFTLVHILQEIDEEERTARAVGATAAARAPGVTQADAAPPRLTPREKEILQWMAAGLQNKEIAVRLSLSLATVRNHVHNTLEKLGVHSKIEAVSLAFRSGWVDPPRADR